MNSNNDPLQKAKLCFDQGNDLVQKKQYKQALMQFELAKGLLPRNMAPPFDQDLYQQLQSKAVDMIYQDAVKIKHPDAYRNLTYLSTYLIRHKDINIKLKAQIDKKLEPYSQLNDIFTLLENEEFDVVKTQLASLAETHQQHFTADFVARHDLVTQFANASYDLSENEFQLAQKKFQALIEIFRKNPPEDPQLQKLHMRACESVTMITCLVDGMQNNAAIPLAHSMSKEYKNDENVLGKLTPKNHFFVSLVLQLHKKNAEIKFPDKKIFKHCRLFLKADEALLRDNPAKAKEYCAEAEKEFKNDEPVMVLLREVISINLKIQGVLSYHSPALLLDSIFPDKWKMKNCFRVLMEFSFEFKRKDKILKFPAYHECILKNVIGYLKICAKQGNNKLRPLLTAITQNHYSSAAYFELSEYLRSSEEFELSALSHCVAVWLQDNQKDTSGKPGDNYVPQLSVFYFNLAITHYHENSDEYSRYVHLFRNMFSRQIEMAAGKKRLAIEIDFTKEFELNIPAIRKMILELTQDCQLDNSQKEVCGNVLSYCAGLLISPNSEKPKSKLGLSVSDSSNDFNPCSHVITTQTCLADAKQLPAEIQSDDLMRVQTIISKLTELVKSNPLAVQYREEIYIKLIKLLYKLDKYARVAVILNSETSNFSEKLLKDIINQIDFLLHSSIESLIIYQNKLAKLTLFRIEKLMAALGPLMIKKHIPPETTRLFNVCNKYAAANFFIPDYQKLSDTLSSFIEELNTIDSMGSKKLRILCFAWLIRNYNSMNPGAGIEGDLHMYRSKAMHLDDQLPSPIFEVFLRDTLWMDNYAVHLNRQGNPLAGVIIPESIRNHVGSLRAAIGQFKLVNSESKEVRTQLECCLPYFDEAQDQYLINPDVQLWMGIVHSCLEDFKVAAEYFKNYDQMTMNVLGELLICMNVNEFENQESRSVFLVILLRFLYGRCNLEWHHIIIGFVAKRIFYSLKECEKYSSPADSAVFSAFKRELSIFDSQKAAACSQVLLKLADSFKDQKQFDAATLCASLGVWTSEVYGVNDKSGTNLQYMKRCTLYFFDEIMESIDKSSITNIMQINLFFKALEKQIISFVLFCKSKKALKSKSESIGMLLKAVGTTRNGIRNVIEKFLDESCDMSIVDIDHAAKEFTCNCVVMMLEHLNASAERAKDISQRITILNCATELSASLAGSHPIKNKIAKHLKNVKLKEVKSPDQKFLNLKILFGEFLGFFKNVKILENINIPGAIEKFAEFRKLIHDGFASEDAEKYYKLKQADFDEMKHHLNKSEFDQLEEKIVAKLSTVEGLKDLFVEHDPHKSLLFFINYFDKKLFSTAGKLRTAKPDSAAAILCYQTISDFSPDLQAIANQRMEKMKLRPDVPNTSPEEKTETQSQTSSGKQISSRKQRSQTASKQKKQNSTAGIVQSQQTASQQNRVPDPATKPTESKELTKAKRPETLPLPSDAKAALEKLAQISLGYNPENKSGGRAYAVGGLVCEMAKPLGKPTDIDLVFGAVPVTHEQKNDPDFILKELQKAFAGAVVEKKDKRLFKVTYMDDKEAKGQNKKVSLDIWWSAALSCPELNDEEARKVDTYGGEWALKQQEFQKRFKNPDEIKQEVPGRDFTMNAMYLDKTGKLEDPTENGYIHLTRVSKLGQADTEIKIANPYLKCIISAEESFGKDPLRALRAVYFASKRDLDLTEPMMETMRRKLTKESFKKIDPLYRVTIILKKLLTRGNAESNFGLLKETGVLKNIFPSFARQLDNHPIVLEYVLTKLKESDALYEKGMYPSLDRIYSTWIFATVMMNRASISKDYTNTDFDRKILQTCKDNETFFDDHFNGFVKTAQLEMQKLENELKIMESKQDKEKLQSVIKAEFLKLHQMKCNKADEPAKLIFDKELKEQLDVLQKEIDITNLVKMRKKQLEAIQLQAKNFEATRRAKEDAAMRQVEADWKRYPKWRKEAAKDNSASQVQHLGLMPVSSGLSNGIIDKFAPVHPNLRT